MVGGRSKSKALKKKSTAEPSSSAPPPFPYLDGSLLEFGSEEELNRFLTLFAKRPISPPRVLPELYPQQKGYHERIAAPSPFNEDLKAIHAIIHGASINWAKFVMIHMADCASIATERSLPYAFLVMDLIISADISIAGPDTKMTKI
ncbi:unnamed protein product, partial [Cuscuta campestris]